MGARLARSMRLFEVGVHFSEISKASLLLCFWLFAFGPRTFAWTKVLVGWPGRTQVIHEVVVADCGPAVRLLGVRVLEDHSPSFASRHPISSWDSISRQLGWVLRRFGFGLLVELSVVG